MPARAEQGDDYSASSATESIDAQRREPFGKNPAVGAKGRATQQRLLSAALELFDEQGYNHTSVEDITERADCSRATLYQYFESKDDLFRRLAGRFGEDLGQLIEGLEPIDASTKGVEVIRGWFAQLVDVHDQYRPIASSFAASLRRDQQMVTGAKTLGDRYGKALAKVLRDPLPSPIPIESLANLVSGTAYETCNIAGRSRQLSPERRVDGTAQWVHRAFFGKIAGVNLDAPTESSRKRTKAPDLWVPNSDGLGLRPKSERTRALLVQSAGEAFSELGYHSTRVDDIVAAASLSHGAFYRYFDDKEAVFTEVATAAAADMILLLEELPDPDDGIASWCQRYYRTYQAHGPLFQIWPEATEAGVPAGEEVLKAVTSTLYDALAGRAFGDADVDSLVLFAFAEGAPHSTIGYSTRSFTEAANTWALVLERAIFD